MPSLFIGQFNYFFYLFRKDLICLSSCNFIFLTVNVCVPKASTVNLLRIGADKEAGAKSLFWSWFGLYQLGHPNHYVESLVVSPSCTSMDYLPIGNSSEMYLSEYKKYVGVYTFYKPFILPGIANIKSYTQARAADEISASMSPKQRFLVHGHQFSFGLRADQFVSTSR